ncbi:ABC transporter substrate-binding protein [Clostridium formicaceticum]|uniref:NMT1/THI5 like protein n=1 Tax=Clostridium formicaceticum TaxID=1497 RepID=A0AAC9WH75_9CLOT|nr:ABC transporter substrate-binding protein [Clostridium formicaceticum]AOY78014.1 hypothetical protein BJL90_20395 [Clostridium formicaceticum]ARE88648.1 NMT1/THI5 like protein [Clostridium formicaceticum]
MKKNMIFFILGIIIFFAIFSGCSSNDIDSNKANIDIPSLKVGYIFTNHQTPLMVAASKGEAFKEEGIYLKEIINREKYVLMREETPVANLDIIVNKNGAETITMMTQGHIDLALASSAAFISAVDQGAEVKMLCPVHTEGIGLVMAKDVEVNNWEEFAKLAKDSEEPIKVGYHSPTSAPLILFEAAIREAGLSYTKNPEDLSVNIMLVDLKGTNNLIPALTSKQVDAWVGPSPYPELAVTENVGKVILDMKHMPPEGKWYDFPCCVAGATQKAIDEYPEAVEYFTKLMTVAANYADEHSDDAAKITSEFTGVPIEAARMSAIKYTTNPSETWITNLGLVYETLKNADSFNGRFSDKAYEEIHDDIFEFVFINKI